MCCDSDSISIWPKHISYLTLIKKVSVSIRDLSIPTHLTQSFGLYPHWHSFFRQLDSLLLFFFLTPPLNNYIEYLFKRCVISTNTVSETKEMNVSRHECTECDVGPCISGCFRDYHRLKYVETFILDTCKQIICSRIPKNFITGTSSSRG